MTFFFFYKNKSWREIFTSIMAFICIYLAWLFLPSICVFIPRWYEDQGKAKDKFQCSQTGNHMYLGV